MYKIGLKARQDAQNEVVFLIWSTLPDDHQRLALGIHARTVHGVTGNNVNVRGQVFLQSIDFRLLHRCLKRGKWVNAFVGSLKARFLNREPYLATHDGTHFSG